MLPRRATTPVAPGGDPVEVVQIAYPRLLALARRLTSPADVEDVVQEAFVETLSRYPGFAGLDSPIGYLTTVLYRTVFRRSRRAAREVPLELQERLELPGPDPDAPALVEQALSGLGPRQRACLMLRYLYDFDDDEIAIALGCRRSTVRSQIVRGLAHAREGISDEVG